MKIGKKKNMLILAPIPALAIGSIVMRSNDLSPLVYGQNIICYLVLALLLVISNKKSNHPKPTSPLKIAIFTALGCALLALTFMDRGLANVHRWLAFGDFRLYISSIILPSMIIGLGALLQGKRPKIPVCISVCTLLLLALQPDASQLSAFALSSTILVWTQDRRGHLKYGISLLSLLLILYSWLHLDALAAVPHVEDILLLALKGGIIWFLLAVASLLLLLVPFLGFANLPRSAKTVGLYYLIVLISTQFGNFPVPIMGFGISPLIGYMLALFFLLRAEAAHGGGQQTPASGNAIH